MRHDAFLRGDKMTRGLKYFAAKERRSDHWLLTPRGSLLGFLPVGEELLQAAIGQRVLQQLLQDGEGRRDDIAADLRRLRGNCIGERALAVRIWVS